MKEDKKALVKEDSAREGAMIIINKHNNGELAMGEYAHELISETYINLISQAQSGQRLCIEGQMLDIKTGNQRRIQNTNSYLNGYRIGRYAVNYQQDKPTVTSNYDENANLTITVDGFLIEEQLDNINNPSGTIIYSGAFTDITQEGLSVLETCLKFSALNYDMFLDKELLTEFSKTIKQLDQPLNDLPLLGDRKHK